jgi:hypothetical protein
VADSTPIGGLTSLRSAWSRCPCWLKVNVEVCRLLRGVVLGKDSAGTWDLPIHAVKYSLCQAAKTFCNTHLDRSLKAPLMRPSPVLARKAVDRMWFRRHWYWPSGYVVVGIIVALLTNNIHLSSISGILLSILAVLLWPFILGAALCRLLGFHIPGINIS